MGGSPALGAVTARMLLATHQENESSVKATRAREQFFTLLESVVNDPTRVVYVEHKDLDGRGMLVGEGYREYVRRLEQALRDLIGVVPEQTMPLAGSMTLSADALDDLDATISKMRAKGNVARRAKFRTL